MSRALTVVLLIALGSCASVVESESRFTIEVDQAAGAIRIFEGEAPVLAYNHGFQLPEGLPLDRERAGYLHPIWGLDGEVLTDDFPPDHVHHRGASLMWPRMKVGELAVELWHIRGLRGHFEEILDASASEEGALLVLSNLWILDDGTKAARERVRILAHPAGPLGRAIDLEFRIEALKEPIMLQGQVQKGYGGLNLRFAPRMDTVLCTDAGVQSADSDRQPFAWADLSARFEDRADLSGVAVLVHPDHPGFPPGWTLRHYGDLNAAWPGVELFILEPGQPIELRYRLWVHRGDAEVGEVAEAWRAFTGG